MASLQTGRDFSSFLLTYSLYNGTIQLLFNEKKHTYSRVEESGEVPVPGVSSILGAVSEGEALSAWKVNTVNDFWLRYIASEGNLEPEALELAGKAAKAAHRVLSKDATDVGSEAHVFLQSYWNNVLAGVQEAGKPPPEWPQHPQVLNCACAALCWFSEHDIKPLFVERLLYSRKFDYAGTSDLVALVDGVLTLLDYKSSKRIYPKHRFQTSAYASAFQEETAQKIEQRILLRLGKEDGLPEAETLSLSEQRKDFRAFKAALVLHRRLKELN